MYCINTKARLNSWLFKLAFSATSRNARARAATSLVFVAEPNSAIAAFRSPVDGVTPAFANKGGIFRSNDRGGSWERRNEFDAGAMYYSRIVADPKDVDRVYVMNVFLMVSDDGGRTLRRLGEKSKHVDNHEIWIDPNNTNPYLVGCDGAVYESHDRGANWDFKRHLPVTQLYDVRTDVAAP